MSLDKVATPATAATVLNLIIDAVISPATASKFLDDAAVIVRAHVRDMMTSGRAMDGSTIPGLAHPRSSGGPPLVGHTGMLLDSMTKPGAEGHYEEKTANSWEMGTKLPYAGKQLGGGTTAPSRTRNLAIPVTGEAELHKPRDFPGVLSVMVRGDRAIGLEDESGFLQYVFKDSVTNPPRPVYGWGPEVTDKVTDAFLNRINEEISRV